MNDKHIKSLFEALALYSSPMEKLIHAALTAIKTDEKISENCREELLNSVKSLLSNSLGLHDYVALKNPDFDFMNAGKEAYSQLRNEVESALPDRFYTTSNLHDYLSSEAEKRKI
jgi:hypothetical protein